MLIKNGMSLNKQQYSNNPSEKNIIIAGLLDQSWLSSSNNNKNNAQYSFSPKNDNIKSSLSTNNMQQSKKEIRNKNTQSCKLSYGERLYHKGIATKTNIQLKTKALQSGLLKKEMKQCTFKPKTLKVVAIEKYISLAHHNKKSITRNHSKSTSEINNCFNQSSRSNTSKKLVNTGAYNMSTTTNNFNAKPKTKNEKPSNELALYSIKLFNDSKRLKAKQTEQRNNYFRSNYPFRPVISKSQERVPAKKYYQKDSMINFFHRLQPWLTHHNDTLNKEYEEELYDRDTGFRLYSPQVNNHISINDAKIKCDKSPHTIANKWEELYLDAKKRHTKTIQTNEKHIESISSKSNSTFLSPRSKEIISSLLKKIFKKIFSMVSPNGIYLNKNSIDLGAIDVKIIKILIPLLYELEKKNGTMNEEKFHLSCLALYNTVSVSEKNVLLEWYFSLCKKEQSKSNAIQNNFTFKPMINSNGMRTQILNSKNDVAVNDKCSKRIIDDACTFRPNQCGSICNITPIDINGSNRITEEF